MTRRGIAWLIGGVLAVLLVVAGVSIWSSLQRPATPEEVALAYLDALAAGDPSAVDDLGVDVSAEAGAALHGATGLITDPEVRPAPDDRDPDDDAAVVEVAFRLGGEHRTADLELRRADGRWQLDAGALGRVSADSTIGATVEVGGSVLPLGEELRLLPAAYTVSASPSTLLEGETPLVVLPGTTVEATVDAVPRPAATVAAQEQLDALVKACTTAATAVPERCGIRIPWGTEFRAVTSIAYRVETPPALTLTGEAFAADGGVLVATVTGTGLDGTARTTTYRTESWALRGDVAFTPDGVELAPW